MENRESSGFVRFNSKASGFGCTTSAVTQRPVVIPEHLRANLPDPLEHFTTKKNEHVAVPKSTSGSAAAHLKEELAQLKEKREQTALRLKEMRNKAKAGVGPPPPPPPPPPMSSFGTGNKKRNT
jgi:hypothetical protein